ncbi:hypothetical protein Poli38472_010458 [Pythium oligandrum]|uniref:EF-hand domain-containing protein n=1 Tax=Pythium oligandrum TaxID=41045 RepID=A0A8K1FAZ3_PYTOL|nr:hypothetical protein Poli38472_010458 [Pythium oligandrum]|eukprot:TMW55576.1 hypothetical protein Poli38472_010458 [Pythium oligandrum]
MDPSETNVTSLDASTREEAVETKRRKPKTDPWKQGTSTKRSFKKEEPWDISRLNKHWEIDKELKRSLPFLARAKRSDRESAGDKFLRLSKLPLPAAPLSETMLLEISTPHSHRQGSQRSLMMTPETKAKYFGGAAKKESHAIFRKLAAQKYLTMTPLNEFLEGQQQQEEEQREVLGSRTVTPMPLPLVSRDSSALDAEPEDPTHSGNPLDPLRSHPPDRRGLFSRQFTARHKFSALCLEKDIPPCIRLIVRNYFSPEINVSHMSIGDDLATVFAECLLDLPMVTSLNVRNNRLGDRGLQAIINMVISKPDLYHIDLSENKVDGDASASLASYMGSSACALQTLKLSHADVDDGELAPFAKALHTNKSLRTLDVSHNLIGNTENLNVVQPSIITGGEALATMLSINHSLTFLDLSWNYLRLGGAVEIGRALAYNSGLRELNLAYNAFGDNGAQAIGEALLSNTALIKLQLTNNNIPAHGAMAIASALKLNTSLTQLNLDGNPLGNTGGRALLHAVASCTDRQLMVSMEGCNFDLSESDAFDPTETTGTYDLNMAIPYERAVALELLRIANTKQGCKFLSITHVVNKQKRSIKVELREQDSADARRRLLKTAGILTDSKTDDEELRHYRLDHDSLRELFKELDQDDSGFIDESELRRGMYKVGLHFREEDIPRYIAQYDLDDTGTIEVEEFIELMASLNLETTASHFFRQVYDVDTNQPFEIPTEGQLLVDFVDFHVSADHDNAHSQAGVERLIDNISTSKNKSQMLEMAKSGLFFKANEAQLLLDSVCDVFEITQAVIILLPNMVDPVNAHRLIDHNLNSAQRIRVQHLMGPALQPILGLSTGHYKIDLGNGMDRLTLKKIVENSTRTAFLRKKEGLKDTSQHGNYHGFRNETFNGKPTVLEPRFLDSMPKFGMLEFDYVQTGRQPGRPMSSSRFEQLLSNLQLEQMSPSLDTRTKLLEQQRLKEKEQKDPVATTNRRQSAARTIAENRKAIAGKRAKPARRNSIRGSPYPPLIPNTPALFAELDKMKTHKNYLKFGEGLNQVVEIKQVARSQMTSTISLQQPQGDEIDDDEAQEAAPRARTDEEEGSQSAADAAADRDEMTIQRNGKETCTAKRLLLSLQWYIATRWVTAQQAVRLLALWPSALHMTRIEAVCLLFDRLVDLHNFNGILSALTESEAAQCFYRFGWLNIWTPLMPDNYYELHLAQYEEREVAKALVRLAIDEPGENWQQETFGWTREDLIPGWELNLSWLKDGGFPEKGYLCLEYYSGVDKGCGPVWPTRRELAASTLCGLPEEVDSIALYVDSLSLVKRRPGTLG